MQTPKIKELQSFLSQQSLIWLSIETILNLDALNKTLILVNYEY